jgi:hypothetical protein
MNQPADETVKLHDLCDPGPAAKERYLTLTTEAQIAKEKKMKTISNFGNALLLSLTSLLSFKESVFAIPTIEEESGKSVALDLQQFFENPLKYNGFTKSLTFERIEILDPPGIMKGLLASLERKVKDTYLSGQMSKLFTGKLKRTVVSVISKSKTKPSLVEKFTSLDLPVKGCSTVTDCLKKYCAPTVKGGNVETTMFTELPNVLHLHFPRIHYNATKKIHQRV